MGRGRGSSPLGIPSLHETRFNIDPMCAALSPKNGLLIFRGLGMEGMEGMELDYWDVLRFPSNIHCKIHHPRMGKTIPRFY